MTIRVDIREAKVHLSRLLERVAAGERVVICQDGTPVADLVPHRHEPVVFGTMSGRLHYDDDRFDEPDKDIVQMFDVSPS